MTVPILIGFFGLSIVEASGSSLLVVGITSLVGAAQGLVRKKTDLAPAFMLAIPSMIGALASRTFLVPNIPASLGGITREQILLSAFSALMLVVGLKMLMKKVEPSPSQQSPILVAAYGVMIGLLSGTLGAGGGFLILPVLTLLLGVQFERAVPTSLLVISIQSLGGFLGELGNPIDWNLLLPITGVALVGMLVGLLLRERTSQRTLQVSFAFLVIAVAIWMISKIL